jgi:The GLUG motif
MLLRGDEGGARGGSRKWRFSPGESLPLGLLRRYAIALAAFQTGPGWWKKIRVGGNKLSTVESLNQRRSRCSGSTRTVAVNEGAGAFVAGLVGLNTGTISNSYVTGAVIGIFDDSFHSSAGGGLVAENFGSISGSYATGAVSGIALGGGLVGLNQGTITNSYATGSVSAEHDSAHYYQAVGGLVGGNVSGNITDSYATGVVVPYDSGDLPGGLIGLSTQGSVTNSYWDVESSGTSYSAGGTGLTTAELESGTLPDGFDPTVWLDTAGQFPQLQWQAPAKPTIASITAAPSTGQYGPGGTITLAVNFDHSVTVSGGTPSLTLFAHLACRSNHIFSAASTTWNLVPLSFVRRLVGPSKITTYKMVPHACVLQRGNAPAYSH